MLGTDGKSRCFGFINFENPDDAARAVQELNGKKVNDKELYVGRAQKKSEREMELKRRFEFEQTMKYTADKYHGLNLYLKNLDDGIGDDQLHELFSNYGKITSCKVMRDQNGLSKGSGFVAFSTREEAAHALNEMNGKMISGKPLYVAFAQRKEARKAMLQAQFSQMRHPLPMTPTLTPRLPMYPPMAPQQLFYGQAPPTMIPPQQGFGFQQQLVPGMRPGGPHMPNYFVPVVQQGQQGPRPGIRRSGAGDQGQQPAQSFQQQMLPRGRMYRYPPGGRSMTDVPAMPGIAGGIIQPYDMGCFPARDAVLSPAAQIGTLTSALANATPEQQRTILGENLYPLVEQLEPNQAAKVTGMLLEMDQTEVLHLLESPEALKSKVAEAMDVLRNVAQQQNPNTPTSQLAALSIAEGIMS
jgi:polyadenylate-binding protein